MSEGNSIIDQAFQLAEDAVQAALSAARQAGTSTEQAADEIERAVTAATGDPAAGAKARQEFLDRVL